MLTLGLMNGLFATLQVVVSSSGAVENSPALASVYYGTHGAGLDPTVIASWLAPLVIATYGSCLVAFAIGMGLCWYAGRLVALAGSPAAGTRAGLLTSLIGSVIWIGASVVGVLLAHADGSLSGLVVAAQGRPSSAGVGGELAGLLAQEIVAALITLGFGALAGSIGASSVPRQPPPPRQVSPGGPPAGWNMYGTVSYPPRPEMYRTPPPALATDPGAPPPASGTDPAGPTA
jgi:hypothetical protein